MGWSIQRFELSGDVWVMSDVWGLCCSGNPVERKCLCGLACKLGIFIHPSNMTLRPYLVLSWITCKSAACWREVVASLFWYLHSFSTLWDLVVGPTSIQLAHIFIFTKHIVFSSLSTSVMVSHLCIYALPLNNSMYGWCLWSSIANMSSWPSGLDVSRCMVLAFS